MVSKSLTDDAAVDESSLRAGYQERGRSGKRGRSGVDERGGGADVVP